MVSNVLSQAVAVRELALKGSDIMSVKYFQSPGLCNTPKKGPSIVPRHLLTGTNPADLASLDLDTLAVDEPAEILALTKGDFANSPQSTRSQRSASRAEGLANNYLLVIVGTAICLLLLIVSFVASFW